MIKVLRNLLIFRSLVATYGVILEQNPSGILISKPIGPGKWVVENFDSISSGLLPSKGYLQVQIQQVSCCPVNSGEDAGKLLTHITAINRMSFRTRVLQIFS